MFFDLEIQGFLKVDRLSSEIESELTFLLTEIADAGVCKISDFCKGEVFGLVVDPACIAGFVCFSCFIFPLLT